MTAVFAISGQLIDAAAQPTKSGFPPQIFIFAVIGAAFYFLFYRPQQKKQKAARELGNAFDIGDEVVTAGGIVGRVLDITDDRVTLETSVGASFVVLRPYVLRKIEPVVPPTDVVDGSDDDELNEHDGHDQHDEQPVPPATPPTPPSEPGDASGDGSTNRKPERAKGTPDPTKSKGTPDPKGPTKPPASEPDGTGTFGADGPPLI